jgi:hypothetical protein
MYQDLFSALIGITRTRIPCRTASRDPYAFELPINAKILTRRVSGSC